MFPVDSFDETFTKLEALIARQEPHLPDAQAVLESYGVPITSIALLLNGEIATHVFSKTRKTCATLFQAASISKPIAALAIHRLVQQGTLKLEASIKEYLSQEQLNLISTPKTAQLVSYITTEQLLSHTSGLTIHGLAGYAPGERIPTTEETLSGVSPANNLQVRLATIPSLQWSYSGGGMTVLQLILETVLKKPFPDIMMELVFRPLGMNRSYYALDKTEKDFAEPYANATSRFPAYHVFPEMVAAGLWTTPHDILLAVSAVQKALDGKDESFMTKEVAGKMLEELKGGYSRGWQVSTAGGSFSHGGANDPGYRCFVMGFADIGSKYIHLDERQRESRDSRKGQGLAIMTNSQEGTETIHRISQAIGGLRSWKGDYILDLMSGRGWTPFETVHDCTVVRWDKWKGQWQAPKDPKDERLEIPIVLEIARSKKDDKKPVLIYENFPPFELVQAAIPMKEYDAEGWSIDLVPPGLDMMLRLGFASIDEPMIELWAGTKVSILEKVPAREEFEPQTSTIKRSRQE